MTDQEIINMEYEVFVKQKKPASIRIEENSEQRYPLYKHPQVENHGCAIGILMTPEMREYFATNNQSIRSLIKDHESVADHFRGNSESLLSQLQSWHDVWDLSPHRLRGIAKYHGLEYPGSRIGD